LKRKANYTPPEAARVLGLGKGTVSRFVNSGRFRARPGGVRRIPHIDLVVFAANHRIPLNFAPGPHPDTRAGP
jgi:excisionase family DNA binding protein